ncbi:unnamed protein product [marine sediment metagenome]|uniref:Uncharacterized protein n=1 Tax=marine sediment metagenome TaxID=412755 RepID=X0UPE6_9ZZZZ
MALLPVHPPKGQHDLKGTLREIEEDGEPGIWYEVANYTTGAVAHDSAAKLRPRFPHHAVIARGNSVYASYPKKDAVL